MGKKNVHMWADLEARKAHAWQSNKPSSRGEREESETVI